MKQSLDSVIFILLPLFLLLPFVLLPFTNCLVISTLQLPLAQYNLSDPLLVNSQLITFIDTNVTFPNQSSRIELYSGVASLFDESYAEWGPNQFSLSGYLFLPQDELLCDRPTNASMKLNRPLPNAIFNQLDQVFVENYMQPKTSQGSILVAHRGNCSFMQKAYVAEFYYGASALIITNDIPPTNQTGHRLADLEVGMKIDAEFARTFSNVTFTIPAIFIRSIDYLYISKLYYLNALIEQQKFLDWNKTDVTQRRVVFEMTPVFADVYSRLETRQSYESLKLAAYFLLILPLIWIVVAITCFIRRKLMLRKLGNERKEMAQRIPIGRYWNVDANGRERVDERKDDDSDGDDGDDDVATAGSQMIAHTIDMKSVHVTPVGDSKEATASSSNSPPAAPTPAPARDHKHYIKLNKGGRVKEIHNDSCCICLTDFVHNQELKMLGCHHAFCIQCIEPWMERSDLCPICKTSILQSLPVPRSCCSHLCCFPRPGSRAHQQAVAAASRSAPSSAAAPAAPNSIPLLPLQAPAHSMVIIHPRPEAQVNGQVFQSIPAQEHEIKQNS